jgi:hypothetical protein
MSIVLQFTLPPEKSESFFLLNTWAHGIAPDDEPYTKKKDKGT